MHATKAWNVCVLEHKDWNDMGESFKVSCNRAASVCSGLLWFLCCHLAHKRYYSAQLFTDCHLTQALWCCGCAPGLLH